MIQVEEMKFYAKWEAAPIGCLLMDSNGRVGIVQKKPSGQLKLNGAFRLGTPVGPFVMVLDAAEVGSVVGALRAWGGGQ